VKALHIKLFRDLWIMRGAVLTIGLVVAAGIAAFVTMRGTWLSLASSRDDYYAAERFGDVFAHIERAPATLTARIAAIPGVARTYTRVVGGARVPFAGLDEPAQALVVSIPPRSDAPLNGLQLIAGRMPDPDRDDEILLLELFARSHEIKPGAHIQAVIEGHQRDLRVAGIAMSPEFVLAVPNGATAPAPERFAVLWMPRAAAEAAFDMRGAFNDVVLELANDASAERVIAQLDAVMHRYGGTGGYARARQLSNYFLTQDMQQLSTIAKLAPIIFLAVAAFLLNVVLSRLVELDRPQIATLKAVGYTDVEVGMHYLQLTLIIAVFGGVIGVAGGAWLGKGMTNLYTKFYRMPSLAFVLDGQLVVTALFVSLLAGLVGAAMSVRQVVMLPPAEAMRPAPPASYKRGLVIGALIRWAGPATRMVLREVARRPMRTVLGTVGVAASVGILVLGQFFSDAMAFLVDTYMQLAQRETMAVAFHTPVDVKTLNSLSAIDGVRDVQWHHLISARVRLGHRERVVMLLGDPERHTLRPLLDDRGVERTLGPNDVLFTETLAQVLHVKPGDTVEIEPLQGDRTVKRLTMTGTLPELLGLWVHMPAATMHRLLGVSPTASEALLRVDRDRIEAVQATLSDMPGVASVLRKELVINEFRKQSSESMATFTMVLTLFAVVISIGVVYNNARVALSLRARELASLRVLGFTRGEIASILTGELVIQVALGIPIGLVFGKLLARLMLAAGDPEAFRLPAMISHHTYSFAALITVCAAVGSAWLVRRQLNHLDLIEVLKTRE